jgi:hypothetical protein
MMRGEMQEATREAVGSSFLRMLRFERRWLVRVFEELLPGGADARLPIGAADVPMDRFVEDLLAHAPLEFTVGLRLCLWIVVLGPIFVARRFRTFFRISPSERMLVLERLSASEVYLVREAPILLKTIACLGFCGLPAVQQSLGIHPTDPSPPTWASKGARLR